MGRHVFRIFCQWLLYTTKATITPEYIECGVPMLKTVRIGNVCQWSRKRFSPYYCKYMTEWHCYRDFRHFSQKKLRTVSNKFIRVRNYYDGMKAYSGTHMMVILDNVFQPVELTNKLWDDYPNASVTKTISRVRICVSIPFLSMK